MKAGLARIVQRKQMDLLRLKVKCPLSRLEARIRRVPPARPFLKAIADGGAVALIAELKRFSPSAGRLRAPYDVPLGARAYARGGARALSVLTERHFFGGRLEHIALAKRAVTLPVLRKDFLFDPYQVYESRAAGADAVLLIAALLRPWELKSLAGLALSLGMTPLVEVHDPSELGPALDSGAPAIGVNSRNLSDLSMDPAAFRKIVPKIPRDRAVVAESGIKGPDEIRVLKKLGVNAVLVGESLLRQKDLEAAARQLAEAGG